MRRRGEWVDEYRIHPPGIELRWVRAHALPLYAPDGELLGYVGSIEDVTQRRMAEDVRLQLLDAERAARGEAERVSRLKDEFVTNLSHELRTPLNAILGWTQILRASPTDPQDLRSGLEVIERNTRAQAQLIADLLDMSRITAGTLRLDVQRVDLRAIIEAAVQAVEPAAASKRIAIHKMLDSSAGPVMADPNRLQQVVWNLLNNAIKFTPGGGQVSVLVERVNSHVEISVSDTGQGISPEFLPYVFERFRQADGSTTRRHAGLGIGLSIAKQLVEMHGGTVRAKSAGEGKGATFSVTLPLVAARDDSPEQVRPEAPASVADRSEVRCPGLRILVVDDELDARSLLKRVLEARDMKVTVASSASEALEAMRSARYDVLISDIGMPEQDGYEFIRQVRRLPFDRGALVPAIALTAFARSEDRTRALMAGYQSHLSKPVEVAELVAAVASLAGFRGGRFAKGEERDVRRWPRRPVACVGPSRAKVAALEGRACRTAATREEAGNGFSESAATECRNVSRRAAGTRGIA